MLWNLWCVAPWVGHNGGMRRLDCWHFNWWIIPKEILDLVVVVTTAQVGTDA